MIKPSVNLQELRRKIYRKAKKKAARQIALTMKSSGKPDDRKGHFRFDVAGAGNGLRSS